MALSGLIRPDPGHVSINGKSVDAMPRRELARRLAYLPQEPSAPTGSSLNYRRIECCSMGIGHVIVDGVDLNKRKMLNYQPYCIAIKPVSFFHPSEEIDESNVQRLAAAISRAGIWTTPIPVDGETGIVMDGNHRVRAAALLGLHYLPCVPLSYQDPRVTVTDWQTGESFCVDRIYRSMMNKKIFPYKTTRHLFAPVLPKTEIQLCVLRIKDLSGTELTTNRPLSNLIPIYPT